MRKRWKAFSIAIGLLGIVASGVVGLVWFRSLPLRDARRALESEQYAVAARLAEVRLNGGNPNDEQAMLIAARAYAALHRWPEAEAYFSQIRLRDAEDLRTRARGLESRRMWSEASFVYEQVLEREPHDGFALQHLTAIRMQQDRPQEAVVVARRLTKIPGYEVVGHVMTGMIENQLGNLARAVEEYEAALSLSPDLKGMPTERWQVLELLAQALMDLGRAAEAEKYALEVREQTANATPCFILGRVRQESGDEDGALAFWEEAIARDPKHVASLIEIARIHVRRRNAQQALAWATRAKKLAPENPGVLYLLNTIDKLSKHEGADGASKTP